MQLSKGAGKKRQPNPLSLPPSTCCQAVGGVQVPTIILGNAFQTAMHAHLPRAFVRRGVNDLRTREGVYSQWGISGTRLMACACVCKGEKGQQLRPTIQQVRPTMKQPGQQ